jgi:hypothetical protein
MPVLRDSFDKFKKGEIIDRLPVAKMPKGILLIGELEELKCETPKENNHFDWPTGKNINGIPLLKRKSKKKPLVCSGDNGKMILIISPDAVDFKRTNPAKSKALQKAIDLATDFHGVEPPEIKKVNVKDFDKVYFFGWLNHIVYTVPDYSERRGLPFIHKAKDKGEGITPSEEKPILCVTPKRDMIIMYGPEMYFGSRGVIG